jgi:hypothetical protein
MRRLFNLIFQLIAAAVFVFLGMAAWIVFDGSKDQGANADVALVVVDADPAHDKSANAVLDRAIDLYKANDVSALIVSEVSSDKSNGVRPDTLAYLENHGIPEAGIIENKYWTQDTGHDAVAIMNAHEFHSVIIVSDYYRISRLKLEILHAGMSQIGKAPVGKFQKEDGIKIAQEDIAIYEYVGKVYLLPAAEKAKEEAQVGMNKASVDAEKAKEKVDKSFNNMAK